jgi:hypothetical protein
VIEKNSSGMVLSDLIISLWKLFKEEHGTAQKPKPCSEAGTQTGENNNDYKKE